ncbi:MAG: YfhO family protein, partial [Fibrobacterota bacterium]
VISLADLFRINTKFVVAEDPDDYIQKDNAIRSIETDEDPFRAYALPGTYRINNYLPVFGIETPGGFHDNELSWYRDYRGGRSSENFHYKLAKNEVNTNPFLNLLNVKYLVFRPDGRGKPAAILNEGAMPRVFTADSYIYDTRKNILGMLRNEKINYRNTVMLEENFPELQKMNFKKTEDTDSLSKSKAKLKEYTPNHRTIEAEMVSDGFLVISDNYYPGWHAKVDGREKEIYRAYGTIKALPLEKGKHEVEIYFSSAYVRTGKKFTLISLILMAGISVFHFIRRFRSGGHSA